MAEGQVRAGSYYRGLRLTVAQQDNGTLVWNIYGKRREARWSEWQQVTGGTARSYPQLTSEEQVIRVLINVLDLRLGALSAQR